MGNDLNALSIGQIDMPTFRRMLFVISVWEEGAENQSLIASVVFMRLLHQSMMLKSKLKVPANYLLKLPRFN